MPRYCTKSIFVEAEQLTKKLVLDCKYLFDDTSLFPYSSYNPEKKEVYSAFINLKTDNGEFRVELGDWVVKDVEGKYWGCKDKDFKRIYKKVGGKK